MSKGGGVNGGELVIVEIKVSALSKGSGVDGDELVVGKIKE